MKVLKIIAGILGVTFTLAILTMIAIITFISPEQFRQQISTAISEKTGKSLVMEGKLHWNIYPILGITADNFLLKDEAIFKDDNFASADSITVYVKLRPLLHKQLIISSIQIEGLKLNLTTLANGQSNWKMDQHPVDKKAKPEDQKPNEPETKDYHVDIHQLEITNGQVNYRDQQNGKTIQLNDLALTAKHLGSHTTFPIDASFELTTGKKQYHSSINTKLSYDDDTLQLTLTDLNLSSVFSNETIKFNTEKFLMNFKTNHVTIPSYTVHYSDLNAKGSLETDNLSDKTIWRGSLITQPFNLRALTKKMGQPLKFGSTNAFTHVQLNSKFTLSPSDIHFSNLAGKIDSMDISGSITYQFSPTTIQLSLYTSQLNLDNYLSSSNDSNASQSNDSSNNKSSSSGINISGDIGVGTFVTDGITLTQVKSNIQLQNQVFKADNFRASVFGGSTQGSIAVNFQSTTPNISLQQNISNIDMQQLQKVLIGSGKMSGRGNVQTNISFAGTNSKAILSSMKGMANLTMTEGQFYGADIDYQLSKIRFTLMKLPGTGEQDRGYTPFSNFRADITFNSGTLRNSHIEMNSPTLSIVGNGSLNMVNKTLDYRVGAQSLRKMDIKTDLFSLDLSEYRIPAVINGSMDKPNVTIDTKEVMRIALKKNVEKTIKGILVNPIDNTINKPGETIREGIQNIKKLLPF